MTRTRLGLQRTEQATTWTPWGPQPVVGPVAANTEQPVAANTVIAGKDLPKPFVARQTISDFLRRHYFALASINRGAALGDFMRRCFRA